MCEQPPVVRTWHTWVRPVHVRVTGAAKLLGPDLLTLKGGTTGFWLETTGAVGDISLCVSTRRMDEQRLTLHAA